MNSQADDVAVERRRAQNRLAQRKLRQRRAKLEQEQQQQKQQQEEEARRHSQSQDDENFVRQNVVAEGCTRCLTQESGLSLSQPAQMIKEDEQSGRLQNTIHHPLSFEELRDRYTTHNDQPDQTTCLISRVKLTMPYESADSAPNCEELRDFHSQPTPFEGILWNTDVGFGIEDASYQSKKDSNHTRVPLTPPSSVEAKGQNYKISGGGGGQNTTFPDNQKQTTTNIYIRHPSVEKATESAHTNFNRISTGSTKEAPTEFQPSVVPISPTASANRGKMALHLCAERGNASMVHFLLNHGAEIDTLDSAGRTALHYAVQNSHLETIAKLLERGADTEILDCEGLTPLHVAADVGCEEAIRLLVQEGADLNTRIEMGTGNFGNTMLA